MLFGQVDGLLRAARVPVARDRGRRQSHPKPRTSSPPARTVDHPPLRPPDLIIQDELHLISGPLGTLVGLYETAIDQLCSWEVGRQDGPAQGDRLDGDDPQGRGIRSTPRSCGTVNVFPPHGLDVRDNFFSLQRTLERGDAGPAVHRHLRPGRRLKAALIRVYVALLCCGPGRSTREYGKDADPWMTLVGYFNSHAGTRRDAAAGRRRRADPPAQDGPSGAWRSACFDADYRGRTDLPHGLDGDPRDARPPGGRLRPGDWRRSARRRARPRHCKDMPQAPLDVLLATNMISVGVDVQRLGLMVVPASPRRPPSTSRPPAGSAGASPAWSVTSSTGPGPATCRTTRRSSTTTRPSTSTSRPLSVTPFSRGGA